MSHPTPTEAKAIIAEAEKANPGLWVQHSYVVADAAQRIAVACGMNGETAYCLGLLHDAGRYRGVTDLQHVFDGYTLMRERGYDDVAQICLTHSFPSQAMEEYSGKNDCGKEEYAKLRDGLAECVYSDYDRLIQLCDSLALPSGVCLMEKRLVDVARRYGVNAFMLKKWEALFVILDHFNTLAGKSVYSLFPEITENTFAHK